VALAQIVGVFVGSPQHKHLALADLEWLVFPALKTGQYRIAEVKAKDGNGPAVAAAVVLWASVSAEVDKKLTENLGLSYRLRPDEWRSGDIPWLIEAAGDARVVSALLKQLQETTTNAGQMKMRVHAKDGGLTIQTLKQVTSRWGERAAPDPGHTASG
jgi:cytolysin-activating lysine-acyltransferase